MHNEFLSISEVAAGKMTWFHFKSRLAICTLVRNDCVNQRKATQLFIFFQINTPLFIFFQINTPTITLTLHCSSTMVGGHEKLIDSNTTYKSSSASASVVSPDGEIAPPLWNVRVDTQYVGIIEEQQQQIKELQEELAEFNCVQYRTLPGNASRGENVLKTSKKMSLTATDHINQQAEASYVREAIWPGNKMHPKSWSKWRDDKRSLCQMILIKVALAVGVDGKSYLEAIILGITNDKFCSLRANFKQKLFEKFQGKFYSTKTSKWFSESCVSYQYRWQWKWMVFTK
jgi:hypothetical protein